MVNVGANATKSKRLTIKELKTMQDFWPKAENNQVHLTWEVTIYIIKKS